MFPLSFIGSMPPIVEKEMAVVIEVLPVALSA